MLTTAILSITVVPLLIAIFVKGRMGEGKPEPVDASRIQADFAMVFAPH